MNQSAGTSEGIPKPGEVIAGKYQVERVLGAGGMGVVLSARHIDLGQRVAIKFLNAHLVQRPDVVARFLREARAAAAVTSEHVARVYDVARLPDGTPYLVMEHLAGQDLDQAVRARGPLPIVETIEHLLQACEALAEAHAAGIVHRDLKPGNLFLSLRADGSSLVKVLDFGMAKIVTADDSAPEGSLTSTSEILGSPWYMSPEQIRSSKSVDHRTDIWALGVVLHKLLSGTQPFKAESLSSCLIKIVTDPPALLRSTRPDAPAELESIILRCLEKDVSHRYQNVAELALALMPFAPESSRLSVERIVRVIGGSTSLIGTTLVLPPRSPSSTAQQLTEGTPALTSKAPIPARAPTSGPARPTELIVELQQDPIRPQIGNESISARGAEPRPQSSAPDPASTFASVASTPSAQSATSIPRSVLLAAGLVVFLAGGLGAWGAFSRSPRAPAPAGVQAPRAAATSLASSFEEPPAAIEPTREHAPAASAIAPPPVAHAPTALGNPSANGLHSPPNAAPKHPAPKPIGPVEDSL
jgi:eukaryotic-like serine/threonine-protein kinase